jgi:hypothetical protein
MSRTGIENARWEMVDAETESRFRMACDENHIVMELESREKIPFMLCPEYRLMCPDANVIFTPDGKAKLEPFGWTIYYQQVGQKAEKTLRKYRDITVLPGAGTHLLIKLDVRDFGLDKVHPMKLRITAGDISWIKDPDSPITLGKPEVRTGEYGWIL